MKKGLEKFISILLLVLGVILIVFLALAVFGELDDATLNNQVVRAMILGLAFVFLICSFVMIAASFKDNDVLKAVVLSSERASTTRVSLSVIKKIVAKNAKYISGLKVAGVALQLDENNAIRMKLTVKISESDVDFVVDRFRCLLYDAFYAVLGVEFASIDFKVKALSPKYAPDMNKVDRAAAEIKEKREKLMLQKLKMEEEEAKYEEERKLEAEKRRREEARLRREREEERKRERLEAEKEQFGGLEDAEEIPVYVIDDNFDMPNEIAGETERAKETADAESESEPSKEAAVPEQEDGLIESMPSDIDFSSEKGEASSEKETATEESETAEEIEAAESEEVSTSKEKDEEFVETEAESADSLDETARSVYDETDEKTTFGTDGSERDCSEADESQEGSEESEQRNDFPDNGNE